jgi:prepilin-type N-terminal cleavage/methylation domain-containing protein
MSRGRQECLPHVRRAGFTLLELIVASIIMAMVALALYQAMFTGFRGRNRVLEAIGPSRAGELTMDLIRRDLECALPPTGIISRTFMGYVGSEVSGSSAVEFYAMGRPTLNTATPGYGSTSNFMPTSSAGSDPTAGYCAQRIELLLRPSLGGGLPVLVRRVTRTLLAPTKTEPDEEVLCRDVTSFHIRYFDGSQWYEDWDSTQFGDTIPMAIEVSLELVRPQDPTRPMSDRATAAANRGPTNVSTYHATRTFFLPCRNESVLLGGVTQ